MAAPRTHYDVLNVSPEAEPVVIEAAYRALIKRYHPDQAEGGAVPKDVAAINEAYAMLKEPARRADYDHRLWTRQQSLRLAELQAGLPRPAPRLSAWAGWLVAGLLACALAAVALGKSLAPPPLATPAEAAAAAAMGEGPARAAAAKAAAAEAASDRLSFPSSAAVIARVHSRPHERVSRPRTALRAAAERPRARRVKASAPARAEPRREDEFLERQGYIY